MIFILCGLVWEKVQHGDEAMNSCTNDVNSSDTSAFNFQSVLNRVSFPHYRKGIYTQELSDESKYLDKQCRVQ